MHNTYLFNGNADILFEKSNILTELYNELIYLDMPSKQKPRAINARGFEIDGSILYILKKSSLKISFIFGSNHHQPTVLFRLHN